jgi:predicted double-glycine peptidase
VALATAVFSSSIGAQSASPPAALLDVPYLPQSEELCGGAAIAMVMRYWGATAVYAETFADLVDADAQGIHGRDLIRALDERGYEARSFEGTLDLAARALAGRRPAIALIEDRPGRFHYVVIVGMRSNRVVIHDPARAPFRVVDTRDFLRTWGQSGYWMLVAQPRATAGAVSLNRSEDTSGEAVTGSGGVCRGMIEEGVRLSGRGDLASAERLLQLAATECAHDPAPWRELAGVHVLRGEWRQAAVMARRALGRDPHDQHATRTLATSLFLAGEPEQALDSWNAIDAPIVDLVDIRGLRQTRYAIAAAALDLPPQTLLTRRRFERAGRRLEALPSLVGSRVTYEPDEADRAKVIAAVVERPMVPAGFVPLTAIAARGITDRELRVNVAGPTGGGELWTGTWRWWERRPRVELGIAAPSPFGGVWSLAVFGETQTYGNAAASILERRRGARFSVSDWVSGSTRVTGTLALDRWSDEMTTSVGVSAERTLDRDRATVRFDGTIVRGAFATVLLGLHGAWQSALAREGHVWLARGGVEGAGTRAPFALWPGAGTGQGREVLLRAHPLLHDGRIRGVFGRRLIYAGGEWRYWRWTALRTLRIAPAAFVDMANADRVPAFGDDRPHLDAGVGLRIAVPGAGVLRVDLGRGLRDGESALSLGWAR